MELDFFNIDDAGRMFVRGHASVIRKPWFTTPHHPPRCLIVIA
jgi:hypothetical protein